MLSCLRIGLAVLLTIVASTSAIAQSFASLAGGGASDSSLLDEPARLVVAGVPLDVALTRLSETSGVVVAFSPSLIQAEVRDVSCQCVTETVASALDRLLAGTSFRYSEMDGQVILTPKSLPSIDGNSDGRSHVRYANVGKVVASYLLETSSTLNIPVQQGTITGRVVSATTAEAISAASVALEGTDIVTHTDSEGRYQLGDVPPGTYRIVVSSIGYGTQAKSVVVEADQTLTVNFVLELDAVRLDELVVTATGEQRRVEVGNVIGTVAVDSLVKSAPVTSVSDVLNARVSGVQIIGLNGMTGTSPDIRIRGLSSMSVSNAPLFIVDGVRVNSQSAASVGARAGFGQWGGRLNDLNPEEIESIDVVKGPSAATLYGTDAANGVVVITTKRGRSQAPSWTAYAEVGMLVPAQQFLDNYYSLGHDADGNVRQCLLVDSAAGVCTIDSLSVHNPLHDPVLSPIGTGYRRQFGAQVSGGSDRFTYFFAGESERETGYFRLPDAEQQRLRAERGGAELPDELVRPNWAEKVSLRSNTGASFGSAELNLSQGLVLGSNQIPAPSNLTRPGEYGQGFDNPATHGGWFQGSRPGETFNVRNTERFTRYTGSLSGSWRPTTWLTTRGVVGLDFSNSNLDALQRAGEGPPATAAGRRQNTRSTTTLHSFDFGASALFELRPGISSRSSVGVQYNERSDQLTSLSATSLPPGSETILGAARLGGSEFNNNSIVAGAYIEEVVGIRDRLYLTGAVRFDGGSSFGRDFQTAVYPKGSVSWLALQRGNDGFLNTVRLRGAYGVSGVQPGATDALTVYDVFTAHVNGSNTAAARPSTVGNPDLKPERQTEFELGADLTLYDGRITLEGTYYNRSSRDALINTPLPPDVGVSSRWENLGSVRNTGFEGLLSMQLVETPGFAWDMTLNGSVNHNELEELGLDVEAVGSPTSRHVEGYPLYGRWSIPITGYDDANGDGIILPGEVSYGDELEFIGPAIPPRQLTLSTGVTLFGNLLRVSTLFDHRGGAISAHLGGVTRCAAIIGNCRAINDPSTPLSDQARTVGFYYGGSMDGFLEDGSFTRWREATITLNVPDRYVGFIGAGNAALTLTGRNLALFTDYSGKDPEVSGQPGTGFEGYIDSVTVPQTRYWILRLTLGF